MDIRPGKGIVVSDLHMGRPDTHGKTALVEIAQQVVAQKPSLIVLNGDIIEAKEYPGNYEQSIAAVDDAVARVRGLVQVAAQENPECRVVYVFGNHDCRYEVAERLDRIKEEFPKNFVTEESALRVHDALFTHGDLMINYDHMPSNGEIVKAGLRGTLEVHAGSTGARGDDPEGHSSWKHVKGVSRGKALYKRIENRAIGAIDTLCSSVVFPLDQIVSATYRALVAHDAEAGPGEKLLEGVKTICIGHIHARHQTVREHEGVTFRVTGPATQFSKNTMYVFDITDQTVENFKTFQEVRKEAGGWRASLQGDATQTAQAAR